MPTTRADTDHAADTQQIDASAPADAGSTRGRGVAAMSGWITAGVLAAAAVAFLVLTLVSRLTGPSGPQVPSAQTREQVLAAAKQCVAVTNTYRYTDVASFRKKGSACTTGQFTKKFQSAVDRFIKPNAPKQKFTQTAQINEAGIEQVSPNGKQWDVLVYGQLNITNSQTGKKGRVDPFAATVTMQQDASKGDKWLIAQLKTLSALG